MDDVSFIGQRLPYVISINIHCNKISSEIVYFKYIKGKGSYAYTSNLEIKEGVLVTHFHFEIY